MKNSGRKPQKDSSSGIQDKQERHHETDRRTSTSPRRDSSYPAQQYQYQQRKDFREAHQAKYHGRPPPKPAYREPKPKAEVLKPTPIGGMCTPTCPIFRCDKRALMIKLVNGKPQAFCTWVNDVCIGYKCQYAFCFQKYLLPDGKCATTLRSDKEEEDAFLKELEKIEENDKLKTILGRKGLDKDLLY